MARTGSRRGCVAHTVRQFVRRLLKIRIGVAMLLPDGEGAVARVRPRASHRGGAHASHRRPTGRIRAAGAPGPTAFVR